MRFKPMHRKQRSANQRRSGFTLAEVLAALVFMAIVIPAAVHGLRIAGLAGQVAERKSAAARIAERLLNEQIVTTQSSQSTQNGTLQDGLYQYRWQMRNEPWDQDALRMVSMDVTFAVQGRDYDVRLTTLFDTSQQQQQ